MPGEGILVFGRGWIGSRVARDCAAPAASADITDWRSVAAELRRRRPRVVVNAAGRTGTPNVDWCETHPVETHLANVAGPLILAAECADRAIPLVHVGSGCVYDGPPLFGDGWKEDDRPNFDRSLYSRSKVLSERALADFPGVVQLRVRMPFDGHPGPRNLITKLVSYRRVIDVPNSVTRVSDLTEVVRRFAEKPLPGIWNVVNDGPVTNVRILDLYREIVDPSHALPKAWASLALSVPSR